MKEHFNLKSLLFYGTMIGAVTLLFRVVSTYGEANLTAPPDIGGRFIATASLPGCPAASRPVLTIQQSGVFLNGSFSPSEPADQTQTLPLSAAEKSAFPLRGRWQEQQINLSGTLPSSDCQLSQGTTSNSLPVQIQGAIAFDAATATFTGNVNLGSSAFPLTARRIEQPPQTQDKPEH